MEQSFITYGHTVIEKVNPLNYERHCHGNYELLYAVDGEGRYIVEGKEYAIRPYTVILIRPYETHYLCPERGTRYERYVFNFERSGLVGAAAELSMLNESKKKGCGVCFTAENVSPKVRALFADIDAVTGMFKNPSARHHREQTMVRTLLSQILLHLSLAKAEEGQPEGDHLITRVIAYINTNVAEPLSLDGLAAKFFVSKYYLCRAFKKHNGISVHGYINQKRIMYAKQLIELGETASGAAYKVGFGDYSAFYRAYVKIIGKSPTE